MVATYDENLSTTKDKIRALIPDTDVDATEVFLQDEQINLVITLNGESADLRLHVAECCEIIAAELGKHAKTEAVNVGGGLSMSTDQAGRYFERKARRLREQVQQNEGFFDMTSFDDCRGEFGRDLGTYED